MRLGSTTNIIYLVLFLASLTGLITLLVYKYKKLKKADIKEKAKQPLIFLSLPKVKIPAVRKIAVKYRSSIVEAKIKTSKKVKALFVNKSVKVARIAKPKEVKRAEIKDKVRADYSLTRAEVFLKLKNFLSAEETALKLLSLNPKDAKVYLFLAKLYREQKNWSDSALCLEQAIKLGEKSEMLFLSLVEAWGRAAKLRKFKASLKQALKRAKTNRIKAKIYFASAKVWHEVSGEDKKSLQSLYSGLKLNSQAKTEYKQAVRLAKELNERGEKGEEIEYFLGKEK